MKKLIVSILAALVTANAYGAFSIQLDAGQLKQDATTTLPSDNTSPFNNGALLAFISAGADGIFETPNNLTPGNFVSGDDVLLSLVADPSSASGFNTSGGTNETNNLFAISQGSAPSGQLVGLMWFPGITYSQWKSGTTPTAGQKFGFYNPLFDGNGTNNPDGGNLWAVPAAGSLINLDFFTTDSSGGGTQTPSEGFANFSVVPEPSSVLLSILGGAGIAAVTLIRRIKQSVSAASYSQD